MFVVAASLSGSAAESLAPAQVVADGWLAATIVPAHGTSGTSRPAGDDAHQITHSHNGHGSCGPTLACNPAAILSVPVPSLPVSGPRPAAQLDFSAPADWRASPPSPVPISLT